MPLDFLTIVIKNNNNYICVNSIYSHKYYVNEFTYTLYILSLKNIYIYLSNTKYVYYSFWSIFIRLYFWMKCKSPFLDFKLFIYILFKYFNILNINLHSFLFDCIIITDFRSPKLKHNNIIILRWVIVTLDRQV